LCIFQQIIFISKRNLSLTFLFSIKSNFRFNGDPLKRDWNDFQHLSTQGRYVKPKIFSG
jgi:hypothetical protein